MGSHYSGDEHPSVFSIEVFDGKRKLKISIDSNYIPKIVDSIRNRAQSYWDSIRSLSFWIIIIASITFVAKVMIETQFPDILTPVRLGLFWVGLLFYLMSDRIVLVGVARARNASMLGCTECASLQIRQEILGDNPGIECPQCGGEMVTILRGGLGRLEFRNPHFELMLERELKKVSAEESNRKLIEKMGIEKAKKDIDQFYEDENISALYCLALYRNWRILSDIPC